MYEEHVERRLHLVRLYAESPAVSDVTTEHRDQWTNWRSGSSVSAYRNKIKLGLQATSNFSGYQKTLRVVPGRAEAEFYVQPNLAPSSYRFRSRSGDVCYYTDSPGLPTSDLQDDAENLARERFYAKLRSTQTAFQGGVFLGELRETIRMLRNPAQSLLKGIHSYLGFVRKHKGRVGRKKAQKEKFLANSWLEYSYGWMPLINDIRSAAEVLANPLHHRNYSIAVIAGSGDVYSTPQLRQSGFAFGGLAYTFQVRSQTRALIRYKGGVRCEAQDPITREAEVWGFTPSEFLPTVWELVPYSFLVDYFTNIGKVIDASCMRKVALSWGVRTERLTGFSQIVDARDTSALEPYYAARSSFDPGERTVVEKSVARTKVDSVPIPSIRFRIPGFPTQWINMAALGRTHSKLLPF